MRYNLPEGWKEVTLGEIVDILGDGLHGTPKYDEEGEYFFINGRNLKGDILIDDNTKRVNYEQYVKYKKDLNDRTIFLSINGTIGNMAYYNNEKIILGKSACYLNVMKDVSKDFIKYTLMDKNFKNYSFNYSTGTTIKNLGLKQIRDFPFYIPPIQEQKAIAHILSTLDDKIEVNNQINKTLENMAQAIFKHWFVDFEFPNEDGKPYKSSRGEMIESEIGMIPKGWKLGTINDLGSIIGGATPSRKVDEYFNDKGIPWITPKDLSGNGCMFISRGVDDITQEAYDNTSVKKMPRGTVLFSSRAPIGYIAISKNEVTTNQGFKSVVPKREKGFSSEFIYCWLKYNLKSIESIASGSTFKEISGSEMKKVLAIIPEKDILKGFRKITNKVFNYIETKETQNQKLSNLRDLLLPKLMSGEIRVPLESEEDTI